MSTEADILEKSIQEDLLVILSDYKEKFVQKGIEIQYRGLDRHGEKDSHQYTSEIELCFIKNNDYLDVYNYLIILHGKLNTDTERFKKDVIEELERILSGITSVQ